MVCPSIIVMGEKHAWMGSEIHWFHVCLGMLLHAGLRVERELRCSTASGLHRNAYTNGNPHTHSHVNAQSDSNAKHHSDTDAHVVFIAFDPHCRGCQPSYRRGPAVGVF